MLDSGNLIPFADVLDSFIAFHTIPTLAYGCHPLLVLAINRKLGFNIIECIGDDSILTPAAFV